MSKIIDIHSPGFKRYLANTSWLVCQRISSMAVTLFVAVYVARYLGPERFGILSYAISFVGLFTTIATLGLDGIIVRELVKTPARRDELLGTAFLLKIFGAVLMWLGMAAIIPFTKNDTLTNIIIAIIALSIIFQAFNVIDFNFQAEIKIKFVAYARFIQSAVSSIIKLVFIWIAAPLVCFACIFLIDAAVLALGMIVIYLKNTGDVRHWKWRWKTASLLLRNSWPLILSGLTVSIYMRVDQVMLKEMLGAEQVGHYAAAVSLSEAWYFLPMALTSSIFPAIINSKKRGEEFYYQRLQKLYNLMVWLAVAIALPTTFLAPWVIEILYGKDFSPAAEVLSIHIWAGVFVFLGVASGKWFLSENFIELSLYRTLLGAIGNVVLNFFLIPMFNINGAAIGTLLANFLAAYLFDAINFRTRKTFLMKTKSLCFIGATK